MTGAKERKEERKKGRTKERNLATVEQVRQGKWSEIKSKLDVPRRRESKRIMFPEIESTAGRGELRELSIPEALGFLLNSKRFDLAIRDRAWKVIAVSFALLFAFARWARDDVGVLLKLAHPISPMLIDSVSACGLIIAIFSESDIPLASSRAVLRCFEPGGQLLTSQSISQRRLIYS